MTDRETLIGLLQTAPMDIMGNHPIGSIADWLIANGVTFQRWIPVSLGFTPERFGIYIVAIRDNDPDKTIYTDCADYDPFTKNWLPHGCYSKGCEILYWMPLPEPPNGERKDDER